MASTASSDVARRSPAPLRAFFGTSALLFLLFSFSGASAPAAGQNADAGSWRLEVGGGGGVLLTGHDHSNTGHLAPVGRVAVEELFGEHLAGAVEWVAAWPPSRIAGGAEKRHHLGLGLSYRPSRVGAVLSLTAGPALATVIRQSGPPEPPGMGDAVIGVGDTMGLGLVAGAGWVGKATGLTLTPRAGVLLQRVDGFTLSHGFLTLSVGLGG